MVSKVCLDCGAVIPRGPRCASCTSKRNILRGSSTARGLGSQWRRVRKRQLRRQPICELRLPGCTFLATQGDHITPREQGGKATAANTRSACAPCNIRRRFVKEPA